MSHIFNLGDLDDFNQKVDLDDLYEKKRLHDLRTLDIFNKILNRIHNKIKITSRQKLQEQFCWFVVPEVMIGVPKYNQAECIAYLIDKLKENGFLCKYIHPNVLFISWKHWIPTYVRDQIKKKTGMNVDGFGKPKQDKQNINDTLKNPNKISNKDSKKLDNFKSINDYKPSKNFVYSNNLLGKINPTNETKPLKLNN